MIQSRGGDVFELAPVAGVLEEESPEADAEALAEGQGREAQEVQWRGEGPDPFSVEQSDLGLEPAHVLLQADFSNELDHVPVAPEQVVVAALQLPAADGEGGGLATEDGSGLEDVGGVAPAGQLVGRGQAGCASANDSEVHGVSFPEAEVAPEGGASEDWQGRACSAVTWLMDRCARHQKASPTMLTGSQRMTRWRKVA